ncbi:unnamed protein product, partial [Meganyctiphanes norvegica]
GSPSKKKSLFSPVKSADSENHLDTKNKRVAPTKKPAPVLKPQTKPQTKVGPKSSAPAAKIKAPPGATKTPEKSAAEKSSESSTNSSSASSESESESSSETSASTKSDKAATNALGRRKNSPPGIIIKQEPPSTESEKDEEDEEEDGEQKEVKEKATRKHITRSASVRAKPPPAKRRGSARNGGPKKPVPSKSTSASGARAKTGKPIPQDIIDNTPLPPIESRKCPVEGCDSTGHLGGKYDKHFSVESCPVFHNFTKDECKGNRGERERNMEEREKAMVHIGSKSPRPNASNEQRNYCNKVRDAREKLSEIRPGEDEMADRDRQPSLRGMTPEWDLQLFLEAQASASEKIEDDLRGLPDTKGIRYIEMGRYEMQAWYQSQYPDEYNRQPKIYICEFCLKYMRAKTILVRHAAKCVWKYPPGDEIYRKDNL